MSTIVVALAFPSGGTVEAEMVSVPAIGDFLTVCGAHYRVESVEWMAVVPTPWTWLSRRVPLAREVLGVNRPGAIVRVVAAGAAGTAR